MLKFILPFLLLAAACSPVSYQNVEQGLATETYICTLPDGRKYEQKLGTSDTAQACILLDGSENLQDTSLATRAAPAPDRAEVPLGTLTLPHPAP